MVLRSCPFSKYNINELPGRRGAGGRDDIVDNFILIRYGMRDSQSVSTSPGRAFHFSCAVIVFQFSSLSFASSFYI